MRRPYHADWSASIDRSRFLRLQSRMQRPSKMAVRRAWLSGRFLSLVVGGSRLVASKFRNVHLLQCIAGGYVGFPSRLGQSCSSIHWKIPDLLCSGSELVLTSSISASVSRLVQIKRSAVLFQGISALQHSTRASAAMSAETTHLARECRGLKQDGQACWVRQGDRDQKRDD